MGPARFHRPTLLAADRIYISRTYLLVQLTAFQCLQIVSTKCSCLPENTLLLRFGRVSITYQGKLVAEVKSSTFRWTFEIH